MADQDLSKFIDNMNDTIQGDFDFNSLGEDPFGGVNFDYFHISEDRGSRHGGSQHGGSQQGASQHGSSPARQSANPRSPNVSPLSGGRASQQQGYASPLPAPTPVSAPASVLNAYTNPTGSPNNGLLYPPGPMMGGLQVPVAGYFNNLGGFNSTGTEPWGQSSGVTYGFNNDLATGLMMPDQTMSGLLMSGPVMPGPAMPGPWIPSQSTLGPSVPFPDAHRRGFTGIFGSWGSSVSSVGPNFDHPLGYPIHTQLISDQVDTHRPRLSNGQLAVGVMGRRTRKNKDKVFDPINYYGRSPPHPRSWGPLLPNGEGLFRYEAEGELKRGLFLTKKEMTMYLNGMPCDRQQEKKWIPREVRDGEQLRFVDGKPKEKSGLTLWIGWVPSQVNDRYPTTDSAKCRFQECAVKNNTIRVGEPRVIFDERMNVDGSVYDPYHNAGYCHLYCLEKNFDLAQLIDKLDVRLDTRNFVKEEDNWGSIKYKKPEMENVVYEWMQEQWPLYVAQHDVRVNAKLNGERPRPRDRSFEENYLTKRMVQHHVEHTSKGQARQRANRRAQRPDAMDIGRHLGNLDVVDDNREARKIRRQQSSPTAKSSVLGMDSNDFDLDPLLKSAVPTLNGNGARSPFGF